MRLVSLLLICTVFSLLPVQAHSAEYEQSYTVPFGVDYDTNPLLSEQNKQAIFRYTVTPSYTASRSDENQQLTLDALVNVQRSSNANVSADRNDPTLNLAWLYTGERDQYNLSGQYDKQSTLVSELNQSGLIQNDGSVEDRSLSAGWSHDITERLTSSLNANLRNTTYSASAVGLSNYHTNAITGNMSYAYSEYVRPFVQLSVTDYKADNTPNTIYSTDYTIGANVLQSDRFHWNFSTGLNHTSTAGNGWIGSLGGSYENEYSTISALAARSVSATGLGGFLKTDNMQVSYIYNLTELSALGTSASINRTQSIFNSRITQYDAFYSKSLNQQWDMRVSLADKHYDTDSTSAHGNVLGLSLIYKSPAF